MIHSVDFIIKDFTVPYFHKLPTNFKKFNKHSYVLKFKDVVFNYYEYSQILKIKTTTDKVLKKGFASLYDLEDYKNKLNKLVEEVTKKDDCSLLLSRIDYCVDLKSDTDNQETKDILELLYKHSHNFKYMKLKEDRDYNTSFCLYSKKGSYNLVCYDRYAKYKDEKVKGIFRIELQVKKYKIKRELKKEKEKVERTLDNYWNECAMKKYYFDFLRGFFYYGDYYRIDVAIEMIKNSSYSINMQDKLIKFITKINENGITETKKDYSSETFRNYIKRLKNIGLNPITISINKDYTKMENLLDRAKRIATEIYFKKEGM